MKKSLLTMLLVLVATMGLQAQIIKPGKGKKVAETIKNGFNTAIDAIDQDVTPTGRHEVLDGYIIPKVGLNLSNLTHLDGNPKIGFTGGFGMEVFVHPQVALGLELTYSRQGTTGVYYQPASGEERQGPYEYSLDYFNTTFMARWYPKQSLPLSVYSGLTFSRNFNAKFEGAGEEEELTDGHVRYGEVSIPLGASYEVGQWEFGLRYNFSFTKLAKSATADRVMGSAKNMKFEATVGYRIAVFK